MEVDLESQTHIDSENNPIVEQKDDIENISLLQGGQGHSRRPAPPPLEDINELKSVHSDSNINKNENDEIPKTLRELVRRNSSARKLKEMDSLEDPQETARSKGTAHTGTIQPSISADDSKTMTRTINDSTTFRETDTVATGVDKDDHDLLKNFEFTNNLHILRLIRAFVYLQYIALAIDSPYIRLPPVFYAMCRGVLLFLLKWYSIPFFGLAYFGQWSWATLYEIVANNAEFRWVDRRRLSSSSFSDWLLGLTHAHDMHHDNTLYEYATTHSPSSSPTTASGNTPSDDNEEIARENPMLGVDFLSARDYWTVEHYAHYFLSITFFVMVIAFTIRFWEVKDFTDRTEMRYWMGLYVKDGWWRRGAAHFAFYVFCFVGTITGGALLLYLSALQFAPRADPRVFGAGIVMITVVVGGLYLLACIGIQFTESAFVRYVSQNVGYTSSIIMKRVLKAKVELGIALIFLVYMPVVYTFIQSLVVIVDWNDTHAIDFRKNTNYHVPCYFLSFPPFRETIATTEYKNWCGVADTSLYYTQLDHCRNQGFYEDRPILQCDTHMGMAMYTTSMFFVTFTTVAFIWIIYSFITLVVWEFRNSPDVQAMYAIQDNLNVAWDDYNSEYPPFIRKWRQFLIDFYDTMARGFFIIYSVFSAPLSIVTGFFKWIFGIIKVILLPFWHIAVTIARLVCNCWTLEGRQRAARIKVRSEIEERKKEEAAKLLALHDEARERIEASGKNPAAFDGNAGEIAMVRAGGREIVVGVEDTLEEDQAAARVRSLEEILKQNQAWILDGFGCISRTQRSLGNTKKMISRIWRRNAAVASVRLFFSKAKGACLSILSGGHINSKDKPVKVIRGRWRKELSISYKEGSIRKIQKRLIKELRTVKRDFVASHSLTITIFDRVIDSGGLFMLISPYRWLCMEWTLALVLEMTIIVYWTSTTNYNEFGTPYWWDRSYGVTAVVIVFLVLTGLFSPYTEDADGWLDLFGRLVVIVVTVAIPYCELELREPLVTDACESGFTDGLGPYNAVDSLIAGVTSGSSLGFIDAGITILVWGYITYILNHIGFFGVMERYINNFFKTMHDGILDFLVAKVDEKVLGAENVFTGILLIQQWDEIIEHQRRYGLFPFPDVRPQSLLSYSGKMLQVKWASAYNLTISNLRSSLGLNLLHTSMCGANGEASRWLIHKYPQLLNEEDSQRDTPMLIAMKECAFFLTIYSKMASGALDDGTSYSDDDMDYYYPEIHRIREELKHDGECWIDYMLTYNLNAKEVDHLDRECHYERLHDFEAKHIRKPTANIGAIAIFQDGESTNGSSSVTTSPTKSVAVSPTKSQPARSPGKQSNTNKILKKNENVLFQLRFPEDKIHDNLESGQMASWSVMGLFVPEMNLQMNDYGDDTNLELGKYEQDLRSSVRVGKKITKVIGKELIPAGHEFLDSLQDFGDDAVISKDSYKNMTFLQKMTYCLGVTGANKDAAVSMSGGHDASEREVRFKICKFAEIFLSKEVSAFRDGLKWNIFAFQDINRMSNKLQGLITQHLALCCNVNPPGGFSRLSDWTLGLPDDFFDEVNEELMSDQRLHGVAKAFAQTKRVVESAKNLTSKLADRFNVKGRLPFRFLGRNMRENTSSNNEFNDRVVQYLSECFVSTRKRLDITDMELGGPSRVAFRGIMRALRREHMSFIIPSIFVEPKSMNVVTLELSKNELDCGDVVLIADAMISQPYIYYLDLTHNRIGSRGFVKLCQSFKGHPSITTCRLNYNRIGPGCSKELALMLRTTTTLKVLLLGHNRMGELSRYPSSQVCETIPSACRDLLYGFRGNKTLQVLDLSYNHLGPGLADLFPICYLKHPSIVSINMSGNEMGCRRTMAMLYALAGEPGRDKIVMREYEIRKAGLDKLLEEMEAKKKAEQDKIDKAMGRKTKEKTDKEKEAEDENKFGVMALNQNEVKMISKWYKRVPGQNSTLAEIGLADNQLGFFCGAALGSLLTNKKSITAIDVSNNSLGHKGGLEVSEALERLFDVPIRDVEKLLKSEVKDDDAKRKKTKRVLYSNLISLNMSRNAMGPIVAESLAHVLAQASCTITDLNISNNKFGVTSELGGDSRIAAAQLRSGFGNNKSLTKLNFSDTCFSPANLVSILGGLGQNNHIIRLHLSGMRFDEPCCLLMSNALKSMTSLASIDMPASYMGPKGGGIFISHIEEDKTRFEVVNLADNNLGTFAIYPLSVVLEDPLCTIHTLNLARNGLEEEGGMYIARALRDNNVLTDLDLSENKLNDKVGAALADAFRGRFEMGRKVADTHIKRIILNNNPLLGSEACKGMFQGLADGPTQHIEFVNCGAGPSSGRVIADALRNVLLKWRVLDISENNLTRFGLNPICWSLRHNRSLRVLRLRANYAGVLWGTDEDAVGIHGIAIYRAIVENLALRELDLGDNGISSNGGTIIIEAMLQNQTIRQFSLAKNNIDDECSVNLGDLLHHNEVIENLDLSSNKLGFHCCLAIAQGLQINRAITTLNVANNLLANAGEATLEHFWIALCMNTSLRVLDISSNQLGPTWIKRICHALSRNNTITMINLQKTYMEPSSAEYLLKAFKCNIILKEVGVSIEEVGEPLFRDFQTAYAHKKSSNSDYEGADELDTHIDMKPSFIVDSYYHRTTSDHYGGNDIVEPKIKVEL